MRFVTAALAARSTEIKRKPSKHSVARPFRAGAEEVHAFVLLGIIRLFFSVVFF